MRVVALDGLSGVGKSTLAPLVANRLGARLLPAIPDDLHELRKQADASTNPTLRHAFYVWAIGVACQRVATAPDDPLWVVESYLGRAMAFHIGMGSTLWVSSWRLVPKPLLSVMVTCDEAVRRERIGHRGPASYWRERAEASIERIQDAYRPFADVHVRSDQAPPAVVADQISQLVTTALQKGATP